MFYNAQSLRTEGGNYNFSNHIITHKTMRDDSGCLHDTQPDVVSAKYRPLSQLCGKVGNAILIYLQIPNKMIKSLIIKSLHLIYKRAELKGFN